MTLAFSGRPAPFGRWQYPHACTPDVLLPVATMSGIGGCESGNQSGTVNRFAIYAFVNPAVLPGTCINVTSSGPGPRPAGSPAAAGAPAGAAPALPPAGVPAPPGAAPPPPGPRPLPPRPVGGGTGYAQNGSVGPAVDEVAAGFCGAAPGFCAAIVEANTLIAAKARAAVVVA